MINRRILRIKTMQSIYSYRVLRDSNSELSREFLMQFFEPDYMAKVPEDRSLLKKQESIAQELLSEWFTSLKKPDLLEQPDKVADAIRSTYKYYDELMSKDLDRLNKKLFLEIEGIYDSYLLLLEVGSNLQRISENVFGETVRNNFGQNKAIEILRKDGEFQREVLNRGVSWQEDQVVLRKFFKAIVINDPEFLIYQDLKTATLENDKEILLHILRKLSFEEGVLLSHMEELDLYWIENKNILKGMIKKTIRDIEDSDKNNLIDLSENWDDDKSFIRELFNNTIETERETLTLISDKAKNWESDRLALTDRIILNMGLAEIMHFTNIPIKVSINEYIDISKSYSTPKSKQFINGLLDKISKELLDRGEIRKSGRGLIDSN